MKQLLSDFYGKNKTPVQFASLQFIFWATFAAYYPFIVVYLTDKGFSSTVTGAIISINSLVVIFAQPFWGIASDWLHSIKKVFILCISIVSALLLSLPLFKTPLFIILVFAVITFFESPLSPLVDSWVIQGIKSEGQVTYGNVRLWGSIGYAIMVIIFGKVIDLWGVQTVFCIFTLLAAASIALTLIIRGNREILPKSVHAINPGSLFKNFRYISFLIFAMVIFIPQKNAFTFLPMLMDKLGGSKGELGLAISIMALSEAPFFFFSSYLVRRFKPIHLIIASSIFFTLRQALFYLAASPLQVILAQILQGPSFALFLTGSLYYIDSMAPEELKATAQTAGTATYAGLSGIIGSYAGGLLIDHYGIGSLYLAGFWISLSISILFILSFLPRKVLFKQR